MSSHDVVRLVDLRDEPLDVSEVIDLLDDPAAGALTLFVGRVRDHDHGRGVGGLDYSAHPSAQARLQDVADQIAAEYDVLGVAAVHRVGTLQIGDIAVIVATVSAHRDESFRASRALIDVLKNGQGVLNMVFSMSGVKNELEADVAEIATQILDEQPHRRIG